MSRPGDRPRWQRGIPKGADPDERRLQAADEQRAAKMERNRETERQLLADREARRRRGDQLTPDEESYEVGHELRDMRLRTVIGWLALLTMAVVLLIGAITVFEAGKIGHIGPLRPIVDEAPRVTPPPAPRLETANGETLNTLRAREDQILNNYTWIDQAGGKVSLPIDRAIELTAQRGLPVRQQGNSQPQAGTTIPQGSSSGRTLETLP